MSLEGSYVFPNVKGEQWINITKAVNRIKKAAGLPADFRPLHGLRHCFASGLASSGQVHMHVLQKLMTHRDPKMTMRYSHLRDESLRKASNLAGQIIEQAAGMAPAEGQGGRVVELGQGKR